MKHILLFLWLIPAALFAQDKWADGLYSTPDIRNVKSGLSGDKDYNAIVPGSYAADIQIFRKSDFYGFPGNRAFNVYPNPAISDAWVVWTSHEAGLTWRLYMISSDGKPLFLRKGTTVMGTNTVNIDMAHYPVGSYFLQLLVEGKNGMVTKDRRETIRLMKVVK